MIFKILKHIFVLLTVILFQMTVFPNMGQNFSNINLVLVTIVFISATYNFYSGVIYALLLGLYLDIYSPLFFSVNIIVYLVALSVLYVISNKFLTNKSFYSLLGLTLIATLVSTILFTIFKMGIYFSQTKDFFLIKKILFQSGEHFLWGAFLNVILMILLFLVFNFSSKQFKAVFIDTTKN